MAPVLESSLELTTPSGVVRIEGEQSDLIVQVPDARAGLDLLRTVNSLGGRAAVETVDRVLRSVGVGLRVRVRGAEVAHVGAGAQPGFVARLIQSAILR